MSAAQQQEQGGRDPLVYAAEVREWLATGRLTHRDLMLKLNRELPPEQASLGMTRVYKPELLPT